MERPGRLFRDAGLVPSQRNNTCDILGIHAGAESPDLKATDWSKHRAKNRPIDRAEQPTPAKATVSM